MNLKDIKISKETVIDGVKLGGKLLGKVMWEGTKVTIVKSVSKGLTTGLNEGIGGVKKLGFKGVVGIKDDDEPKLKLFSKEQKDETEELIEEVIPEAEVVEVSDVKVEEPKTKTTDKD